MSVLSPLSLKSYGGSQLCSQLTVMTKLLKPVKVDFKNFASVSNKQMSLIYSRETAGYWDMIITA